VEKPWKVKENILGKESIYCLPTYKAYKDIDKR
jgi:hypothetical protein